MAIHYKDKKRGVIPAKPLEKPYRLLGVNETGKIYFYWSQTPAQHAADLSPNEAFAVL